MLSDYLPILMLLGLSTVFALASIGVASFAGPRNPTPAKLSPYECGIVPERLPREKLPVKFYAIAMMFIIFDVEVIFFYPFAVMFRELGLFGLAEMGIFVALLLVAYVYVWRAGGLEWDEEASSAREAATRHLLRSAERVSQRLGA